MTDVSPQFEPPRLDLDPVCPAALRDPQPGWARARREAPVFYSPDHDMWWVTRYADVAAVLRDTATYSSRSSLETPPPPEDLAPLFQGGMPWEHTLVSQDPPLHTRLRKLTQYAFTPRQIEGRADEIRSIAEGLLDEFGDRGTGDLVQSFGGPLPLIVISRILGVPDEDRDRLRHWTEMAFALVGGSWALTEEQRRPLWEEMAEFVAYARDLIADRRNSPRDDLITNLVDARADDDSPSLTTMELVGTILSLVAAGNETSASLITKVIYLLLRDRPQWEQLCDDHSLIAPAVEEALRYSGPVNGVRRVVTEDTVLGGVAIPAGAGLFLALTSANRDEEAWPDADRFDIGRSDLSQHLGLGRGRHFCLGAPLARLEARIAVEAVARRHPDLRLVEGRDIEYQELVRVHSPKRLDVQWGDAEVSGPVGGA